MVKNKWQMRQDSNRILAEATRRGKLARYKRAAEQTTFTFSNNIQKDLWEEELTGQISDGMWENSKDTGWQFWCAVHQVVGNETKITGWAPDDTKYNFSFTLLIPIVGDRMIAIGRQYDPLYDEKKLRKDLKEIKSAITKFKNN
jgi:hypothetical protein